MKQAALNMLTDQNYGKVSKRVEKFISDYVSKSSAKGIVLGLSGGLDSSVVFELAVRAVGSTKVLGLIMPSDTTPREDTEHALEHARSLGAKYHIINIQTLLDRYSELLPKDKMARGNLMARVRMNILYYYANLNNYLVAGTSDKSEIEIGYFTKWGDGACDIMPIAALYKTQVRALARYLQIPQLIIEKKSSPRLWSNHLAEKEIGMEYETIDPILYLLLDKKKSPRMVAKTLNISTQSVDRIRSMRSKNLHKRGPAPAAL
jgi:NAD+ synthase